MINYHKYQEGIQPIPTRSEQIAAMEKLRNDWVAQPYRYLFMNQPVRQSKIEFSHKLRYSKLQFIQRLFWGTLVSSLLIKGTKKFFMNTIRGTPVYYQRKWSNAKWQLTSRQWRELRFQKFSVPLAIFLGMTYACCASNWSLLDEDARNMQFIKHKRIM